MGNVDASKAVDAMKHILESNESKGKIILLSGSEASDFAKKFTTESGIKCGHIDLRLSYDENPYEMLAFRHIGWFGSFLNSYLKGKNNNFSDVETFRGTSGQLRYY